MSPKYEIGPFRLDPRAGLLTQAGSPVALGARGVAVLSVLIKHANQFVTKTDIIESAWPGMVVEESNLSVQIAAIRRVFAQAQGGDRWVETLPRRGYRFVGPVTALRDDSPEGFDISGRSNLPEPVTTFIGRERELVEIKRLLPATRLLTIVGVGGIGKTRLALQVASEVVDAYRDGVWLVDLAPLTDSSLVPSAMVQALGAREMAGRPLIEALCSQVKGRQLLLVLDNCEHLLDSCAKSADTLLRQCSDVQVLASSRESLGIAGEQVYRVPSLSLPDPKQVYSRVTVAQFEAVQLFTERAVLVRADFEVTDRNASALASVCYKLDGIPLAIELAARRVRSLTVEEIDAKLDQRFGLLTGGSRTALPRHQTLRSLIDWSYGLLSEPEKRLLQRLSVFAGGWTLESAEHVCTGAGVERLQIFDLLTSLSDKSLVTAQQKEEHTRYGLLETVRQYGRDRLLEGGNTEVVRSRHLDYFLALAEEAYLKLRGREQVKWLQRLEQEYGNLRSALEWALEAEDAKAGLRFCGALGMFWWIRGYLSEGREWCARALRKRGAEERTLERGKALNWAGALAHFQTDYRAAEALGREELAIFREVGSPINVAASLCNLGAVARAQGDLVSARTLLEESLAIQRDLGDHSNMARSLNNLGRVVRAQGDYSAAQALLQEAVEIKRKLDDPGGVSLTLLNLGHVACDLGDIASARGLYKESLTIQREVRDKYLIASSLAGLAEVVAAFGNSQEAARIWGAAERLGEEIGSPTAPDERPRYDRCVAAARAAVGNDAVFDRAWQGGRALTLEQAIDLALEKAI